MSVKTRTRRLTAGCFAAAALAAQATGAGAAKLMDWPDLLGRPLPAPSEKIAYGPDPMQFGELWIPDGKGPFPVVLMVHGGCWLSGVAKLSIMNYAADDLRQRGIAVWNIEYRGVDRPGGGYPGTFQDVAAGADALATIAPAHHLRLDRVVALGHSAGGHFVLWLAARSRLPAGSALNGRASARHRRRRQPGRPARPGARSGRGRLRRSGQSRGWSARPRPPTRTSMPTPRPPSWAWPRSGGADQRRRGSARLSCPRRGLRRQAQRRPHPPDRCCGHRPC